MSGSEEPCQRSNLSERGTGLPRATQKVNVRRAERRDLGQLRRIIVEAFGHETIHCKIEERYGVVGGKAWDERKADEIESFLDANPDGVLVSEIDGRVVGFICYSLDEDRKLGIVGNNAVDPRHQGRGIGTIQVLRVLEVFRGEGMRLAEVSTGRGPGYASARRIYEKCGFRPTMESMTYHCLV